MGNASLTNQKTTKSCVPQPPKLMGQYQLLSGKTLSQPWSHEFSSLLSLTGFSHFYPKCMFLVSMWARLRPFHDAECFMREGCKAKGVAGDSRRTCGQVAQGVLCLRVRFCVSIHAQAGLVTGKDSSTGGSWVTMPFWKLFLELECTYRSDWQSLSVLWMWGWSRRQRGAGTEGGEGHGRAIAEDQLSELGGKGMILTVLLAFPLLWWYTWWGKSNNSFPYLSPFKSVPDLFSQSAIYHIHSWPILILLLLLNHTLK